MSFCLSVVFLSFWLSICCIKLISETWQTSSISMPKISFHTWVSPSCTCLWTCSHFPTSQGVSSRWRQSGILTGLASSHQPWKAAHKEQKSAFLDAALKEARSCTPGRAALNRGRTVRCFHESETQRCLSPMVVQDNDYKGKFLQLKYQLLN